MPTLKPEELTERLREELLKIGGDISKLPEVNNSNSVGRPFIEIDRYGYNYVCIERDEEIFRKLPLDTDTLIFEVFKDITRSLASKWESKNRKEKEDSRRQVFAKQIELMSMIKPEFGAKLKTEFDFLLRIAPYNDSR